MVGVRSIYEILCVVLLFTGAVIGLLAFFMMSGNTSYMSVVASYSLLIVGTSLLFGYTLHNLYNINKNGLNDKKEGLVRILFLYVVPFILMVLNQGYLLYLITVNKSIVTSANINNDYSIFSKIFIILTIIQTSMLYYSINTSKNGKIINPVYNSLIVLISIINFYIIRIIKIVIVDYPVDCITCPLPPPVQSSSTTTTSTTSSSSSSTSS
jgi:succinate dehydrogenase hydrophobic anchor subunit